MTLNNYAQNLAGKIVFSPKPGSLLQSYRKRYGIAAGNEQDLWGEEGNYSRIENVKSTLTLHFCRNSQS